MGFNPVTVDDQSLASLIGSRLCHDLVSPIGAIGNGLELLRMTQETSPELDLVEEAVKVAQARIRLFRLAFGAANAEQSISAGEFTQALDALSANGRISVQTDSPAAMPRFAARRLALAALCAETAMAWGGDILVGPTGISAQAKRLKLDDDLWQALAAGRAAETLGSSTVHIALLAGSGPVSLALGDTSLTIRI